MPEVIDNVKVGQLIRSLLKERKMTQEDLASHLLISKSAVSQNLSGKSSFDIHNLVKIAELFNISLDDLLSQKTGANGDAVSEYEKAVKKGLEDLKRVKTKDLNIKEPDLYGKTFIEYVIQYEKVDMFEYLHESGIALFYEYNPNCKAIYYMIIEFMLRKNIRGIERYVMGYVGKYGAFQIDDDEMRIKIFSLLNREKSKDIVAGLMRANITQIEKVFGFLTTEKHIKVLTKEAWIEAIAKMQLKHIFQVYMIQFEPREEFYMIIKTFKDHNYTEGCHMYLDYLEKINLPTAELKQLRVQEAMLMIVSLNDLRLYKSALVKGFYLDLNALMIYLVQEEKEEMLQYTLHQPNLVINYRRLLHEALIKGNLALLKQRSNELSQDDKNYLLSQTKPEDIEASLYLLSVNARFATKYHNLTTYDKITNILHALLNKEGEDDDARIHS